MTPKEKAKGLYMTYLALATMLNDSLTVTKEEIAKQCALIAVEEILDCDCRDMSENQFNAHIDYWQEVKNEIEKL